ncbi:double-strand break repair helicase AddA [Roseitranquillus sediminis]|uniref:double-strand break repair helicase AddA n=1 Tax=Roseitranquillus sediminis TaxID=2809051 RepID=UPI001D0C5E96|nr:double-strand break repair helicase AddA [Roseitranquillus sediminis]MBM9596252.1 double-strand break repair helicase AddA [Roseitranquillus sediminis]
MSFDEATLRQHQAAEPRISTWLSANAGSGKTRVLTDRVARLLLERVPPAHVLCLTYTRAAASEMQNRLFRTLGDWAMRDDADLTERLRSLGVTEALPPEALARARTLFARAIETPGGLRIQTIHAFCAAILRRFPLEAGVTPHFAEMDDNAAAALRTAIVDEMADGSQAGVVDALARHFTGADFDALTAEIARHRDGFGTPLDLAGARGLLGLPPGLSMERLVADVFDGAAPLLREVTEACSRGSTLDVDACQKLRRLDLDAPALADLLILEDVLLTKSGATPFSPSSRFPTKPTRAIIDAAALDDLMERVADARRTRCAIEAAERTAALHGFAAAFLPLYEGRKARTGRLDYDDLILKARRLLDDPSVADWVLFRLDGGIDHILIDEAQDTSPLQWEVIERLAREFASGRGAREVERTLFVVGDKKQSIYSFQGADPAGFDRMYGHFRSRLAAGIQRLELLHSFRSSRAILQTVDACFEDGTGLEPDVRHNAFHEHLPGRVDLWPVVPPPDEEEEGAWYDPVDKPTPNAAHTTLARQIAAELRRMIDAGVAIPDEQGVLRPIRPGDVLILMQRRNELFHGLIRALKEQRLEVAGADRMRLTSELAVRDILSLCKFLALPEDDLSLAEALRSPLFGWSEGRFYDLAHGRSGHIWQALRGSGEAETLAVLRDLLDAADFLRPYELIERILIRHDGRGRLLARLGEEAEDGIDELLNQAIAYERTDTPSLTGFLSWIEAEDIEVRRDAGSAGNRIRVMTVHGAKGLESPLVILPDTLRGKAQHRNEILPGEDGLPLWKMRSGEEPPLLAAARAASEAAEAAERRRLLYVAATRARTWLIVCGAGQHKPGGDTWYDLVAAGLARCGAVACDHPTGQGLRDEHGDWSAAPQAREPEAARPPPPQVPDVAAPPPPARPQPLVASNLGGAKALPGEGLDEAAALLRGTRLHLLLEHLPNAPRAAWPETAATLLDGPDPDLLAEAAAVLESPALAFVFAPDALAEVPFAAAPPNFGARTLRGVIDRLIVGPDAVLCIDFKTNRTVPNRAENTPNGLLRQMGAYAAALTQIYPDRRIDTAILWTRTATLMPLPPELTTAALLDALSAAP